MSSGYDTVYERGFITHAIEQFDTQNCVIDVGPVGKYDAAAEGGAAPNSTRPKTPPSYEELKDKVIKHFLRKRSMYQTIIKIL